MNDIKITFFMLVTDPDIILADYAVRSYAKIKDIPFKLRVYSNWVSSALKQKYFTAWRKFDFVEIIENEWQTDDKKPTDSRLEGRYEKGAAIWDRELKKIQTPYHATVDADFEILDAKFISVMLAKLDTNPNLIAMSTDYFPKTPEYYNSFTDEVICLNERWPTWFCIYKREALKCTVSHFYYEERTSASARPNVWDDAGCFQKALKEDYGYEIAVLERRYQPCFIHHGSFSKNCDINEKNVALYRRLQILRKRGLFGKRGLFLGTVDKFIRVIASLFGNKLFGYVDRTKNYPGWGKGRGKAAFDFMNEYNHIAS